MIIAVDPSIRSCGIAMLEDDEIQEFGVVTLGTSSDDYPIRATVMAEAVSRVILGWAHGGFEVSRPSNVIIETPAHWASSSRGRKSEESEDIQKVYWFVGALVGRLFLYVDTISLIRPISWKGTQPKDVMVSRARRHLGKFAGSALNLMPHDAMEAALLAIWMASSEGALRKCTMVKPSQLGTSPTVFLATRTEDSQNCPFVS